MKKSRIIILIVVILIICAIAGAIFYIDKKGKEPLFKYSYENHTWEDTKNGYIIYFNGTIELYDENNKENTKKQKLTKDEIKQLKELANSVEDEYQEYDTEIMGAGLGTSVDEIYSRRLKKWITISRMEDDGKGGGNLTDKGEEILNLAGELYKKYLEDEDDTIENTDEITDTTENNVESEQVTENITEETTEE